MQQTRLLAELEKVGGRVGSFRATMKTQEEVIANLEKLLTQVRTGGGVGVGGGGSCNR